MPTHFVWLTDASTSNRILVNLATVDRIQPETRTESGPYTSLVGRTYTSVTETPDAIAVLIGCAPRPEASPDAR